MANDEAEDEDERARIRKDIREALAPVLANMRVFDPSIADRIDRALRGDES